MTGLQHLQTLDREFTDRVNAGVPSYARSRHTFRDKTANQLTQAIIRWLKLNGHWATRINSTGRYLKGAAIIDTVGRTRVMPGKWIPGTTKRGTADIHAVIRGRHVSIEVKTGKDRMSNDQHKVKETIESCGGIYFIAKDFQSFYEWYKSLTPGGG